MIEIRKAGPGDAEALSDIKWRASWTNEADRPWLAVNEDEARKLEPCDLLVLCENDTPRAYLAMAEPSGGQSEIDGLFTDPDHMRRGFARQLVEAAIDHGYEQGLDALTVSANTGALAFYLALGFHRVGPTGATGIQMRLCL